MRVLHRAAGSESVAEPASNEPRLSGQTAPMSVLESQLDSARKGVTVTHISSVHATVKTASALRFSDGGGLTPSLNICGWDLKFSRYGQIPPFFAQSKFYKFRLEEEW
jgi:hypothetical protein